MLRLVVDEAQRSSSGIETGEGKMIKNVLDMQDKEVGKIMQPRVDVVALPDHAAAIEILHVVMDTKFSRIPIYRDDVDHIIGVVFSKDLLNLLYSLKSHSHSSNDTTSTKVCYSLYLFHYYYIDCCRFFSFSQLIY